MTRLVHLGPLPIDKVEVTNSHRNHARPMDTNLKVEETVDPPMHVEQVHITFQLDEDASTWIDTNRKSGTTKPTLVLPFSSHADTNQPLPIKLVKYNQLPLTHICHIKSCSCLLTGPKGTKLLTYIYIYIIIVSSILIQFSIGLSTCSFFGYL